MPNWLDRIRTGDLRHVNTEVSELSDAFLSFAAFDETTTRNASAPL
jgi:hypothetical protein